MVAREERVVRDGEQIPEEVESGDVKGELTRGEADEVFELVRLG